MLWNFCPKNDNGPSPIVIHPNHKPCASDIHYTLASTFSCLVQAVNGRCPWLVPTGKVEGQAIFLQNHWCFFLKTFRIALSIGTESPTSLRGPVEIKPTVSNFRPKKDNSPWSFFICISPTSECSPSLYQPPPKVWRASGGSSKFKLTLWDFRPENDNSPLSFFILVNPTYERFPSLYQPPPKVWRASERLSKL